jgi:hypothetical protein
MQHWLVAAAAMILVGLGGCSSGEEAPPFEWKCKSFSSANGPFCECEKSTSVRQDWPLDACSPTPCCVAGQYQDGETRKCVCYSQEFLDTESFTCAEAVEYGAVVFASSTPWSQVSACPN